MEMVMNYLQERYIPKREALPFPQYLEKKNKWQNPFWITRDGVCIYPYEIDNRHLHNIIRLIHSKYNFLSRRYDDVYAYKHIEYGFYVYEKFKHENMEVPRHIQLYCDMWTDYPLYMLLRREAHMRNLGGSNYEWFYR